MISLQMSDKAIREALGQRIQAHRLLHNQDQESLAYEAGISASTLYRLEKGSSVSIDAYIKVLRVLGLLERLDDLIPPTEISPIQRVREKRVQPRQRATGSRKSSASGSTWQGFKQEVHFDDEEGR